MLHSELHPQSFVLGGVPKRSYFLQRIILVVADNRAEKVFRTSFAGSNGEAVPYFLRQQGDVSFAVFLLRFQCTADEIDLFQREIGRLGIDRMIISCQMLEFIETDLYLAVILFLDYHCSGSQVA